MKIFSHRIYVLLILTMLLTSCLSPVKNDTKKYVINQLPCVSISKKHSNRTLLVLPVDGSIIYNTTQMAYRTRPFQVNYYAINEWADTPAAMLQPLLEKTLQNTGYFKTVVSAPYTGLYQYALKVNIVELLQDYSVRPCQLHLVIHAQLSRGATGRIIATRDFGVIVPISSAAPYNGVIASNAAVSQALLQLATFTINNSR